MDRHAHRHPREAPGSKRRIPLSTMGAIAAKNVLEKAKVNAESIDAIVVATMTPDFLTPSTAALIQHELGAKRAACIDIQAACSGFLYGLSIAKGWIESGMYKRVLVIATEKTPPLSTTKTAIPACSLAMEAARVWSKQAARQVKVGTEI